MGFILFALSFLLWMLLGNKCSALAWIQLGDECLSVCNVQPWDRDVCFRHPGSRFIAKALRQCNNIKKATLEFLNYTILRKLLLPVCMQEWHEGSLGFHLLSKPICHVAFLSSPDFHICSKIKEVKTCHYMIWVPLLVTKMSWWMTSVQHCQQAPHHDHTQPRAGVPLEGCCNSCVQYLYFIQN